MLRHESNALNHSTDNQELSPSAKFSSDRKKGHYRKSMNDKFEGQSNGRASNVSKVNK
jgi:hypothetical protein